MDASELLKKWTDQKRMHCLEGDSGLQKLEELFKAIGYGHGFRFGDPIQHFLSDNSGACEALLNWFEEQLEYTDEWKESMAEELGVDAHEEEDEEEDDRPETDGDDPGERA